jgi:hypothetical protein
MRRMCRETKTFTSDYANYSTRSSSCVYSPPSRVHITQDIARLGFLMFAKQSIMRRKKDYHCFHAFDSNSKCRALFVSSLYLFGV